MPLCSVSVTVESVKAMEFEQHEEGVSIEKKMSVNFQHKMSG